MSTLAIQRAREQDHTIDGPPQWVIRSAYRSAPMRGALREMLDASAALPEVATVVQEPMTLPDKSLLERMARGIALPSRAGAHISILAQAASSYGARPIVDEATVPTGFDPAAAALFEAVVEAAFLVANSDGVFDDDERAAFQSVVANACGDVLQLDQLDALVADLCEQLAEDGMEKRAHMIARTITKPDLQQEVLRIAAMMAHISGGVSDQELAVLEQLARGFGLKPQAVNDALADSEAVLAAC